MANRRHVSLTRAKKVNNKINNKIAAAFTYRGYQIKLSYELSNDRLYSVNTKTNRYRLVY